MVQSTEVAAGQPDGPPDRPHRIEITARTMFTLLLVLGGAWILLRLAPVILMIIASLMLVGSLNPTVERLQKRGMRRGAAIGIVFGVLLAIVLLLVTLTIPDLLAQATALLEREPVLREQLAQWLARRRMTASLASSLRQINYASLLGNSAQFAFTTSLRVAEMVAYGFGAVFLALYVMLDRDRLRGSLYALVPRTQHIALSRILLNLERIVGGYIRGQVITCVAMGLFMFAVLRIAGVKSALALAVLAGVADVLPYVGGLLALGPAVLATLSLGPIVAGSVAAAILVYQEVESRLLVPMVYGRALRLPSSVVLVALLTGGTLNGIVGAILALPVAAAILMLIDELRVDLPGRADTAEQEQKRSEDDRTEREYTERTEGMPVHEAAAVAVAITTERTRDEEIAASPSDQ